MKAKKPTLKQALQNEEKRTAELALAIKELAFQSVEKEKRAAELILANKELAFQNEEKEKRAAELILANKELAFQNEEKEKRAAELVLANKELESFTFISSHDLQEPLRKIQMFSGRILTAEHENLSDNGKVYFERIQVAALHMQTLINDLLAYSRTSIRTHEKNFVRKDLHKIVEQVKAGFKEELLKTNSILETNELCEADIIPFQFRQLLQNLISNALKFSKPDQPSHILIKSFILPASSEGIFPGKEYCHISVSDNGIGFEPQYKERIFELFERLNEKEKYKGTGIGLTIVKKIVENHDGVIHANGQLNKGATFDIYIPSRT